MYILSVVTVSGPVIKKAIHIPTKPVPTSKLTTEKIQLPILGNSHKTAPITKKKQGIEMIQLPAPATNSEGKRKIENTTEQRETMRFGFQKIDKFVSS